MTIAEAVSKYGTKVTQVSANEDLFAISARLYNSTADVYLLTLQTLNTYPSWEDLEPGSQITYLSKQACSYIDEVTS